MPEHDPATLGNSPLIEPRITRLTQGSIQTGPVLFEATGGRKYPLVEGSYDGLGEHGGPNQLALDYAQAVMPHSRFSVLGHGLTSVVLEDDSGLVFKVFRDSEHYGKYEDEMAALTLGHQLGLAPKAHLLIDAAEEYRRELFENPSERYFGDIIIPRQEVQGWLPIIVMGKVDSRPIAEMPATRLKAEFTRIASGLLENNMGLTDIKVLYDPGSDQATLIDFGDVYRAPKTGRIHGISSEVTHTIHPLYTVFSKNITPSVGVEEVAVVQAIIDSEGLNGLSDRLTA